MLSMRLSVPEGSIELTPVLQAETALNQNYFRDYDQMVG